MKPLRAVAVLSLLIMTLQASSHESKKPLHPWELMMNSPEARDEAKKLLGNCGDAKNQAAMNACFAMEFQSADGQMNREYQQALNLLEASERQRVRAAQRAWLRYRDLHCAAVGTLQAGGGSLEPTEVFGCKAELTKERTKEFSAYLPPDRAPRPEQSKANH